MRRSSKIVMVVVAAFAALFAVLVVRTLRYGFSTHDEPTGIEVALAGAARHLAVPADLREANNPLPASPAVLADARAHWADHCASCHGLDGRGQTTIGRQLYPRAPDMTLPATQELSDGELFATIENGIRLTGMPGWGEGTAASAYGSWSLVHLIRRLPELAPDELAEMDALAPKSPGEWRALQEEAEFLAGEVPEQTRTPEVPPTEHHH